MRFHVRALGSLCALMLLCVLPGCGSSSRGRDGEADVFIVMSIQEEEANAIVSDVSSLESDFFQLLFSNRAKAPTGGIVGNVGEADVYLDVRIETITFHFTNLDTGGSVPGVDVPAPWETRVGGFLVDVDSEAELDNVPVVTVGMKRQPPLNDPANLPFNAAVRICAFGRQLNGDPVSDCFSATVLFCDFREGGPCI